MGLRAHDASLKSPSSFGATSNLHTISSFHKKGSGNKIMAV